MTWARVRQQMGGPRYLSQRRPPVGLRGEETVLVELLPERQLVEAEARESEEWERRKRTVVSRLRNNIDELGFTQTYVVHQSAWRREVCAPTVHWPQAAVVPFC